MTDKYYLANSEQMNKRKILAEEFYNAILDPEEIPFIVTDEANLYDIYIGGEHELIQKAEEKYGVTLDMSDFKIPFWQLLDFLEKNRKLK